MAAVASRPERKPSQPAPLTLSSWSGKVVEWSVPLDANFADCDLGQYQTWTVSNWGGGDVGQRFQQAPGQMNRYYALDINGTRLVIDESWGTDATARSAPSCAHWWSHCRSRSKKKPGWSPGFSFVQPTGTLSAARSSSAMSILTIFSMASIAR
jgi:hypothetical protein